jgi:hypothetical protein
MIKNEMLETTYLDIIVSVKYGQQLCLQVKGYVKFRHRRKIRAYRQAAGFHHQAYDKQQKRTP